MTTLNVTAYNYEPISTLDSVLIEAFQRAGINPMPVDENVIRSAKQSVCHELSQMPFSATKLWLRQRKIIEFKSGQTNYTLDSGINDIQDLVLTLPSYLPNTGTASADVSVAPGTSPQNCFTSVPNAGCILLEPNGAIQYDYGAPTAGNPPTSQFVYYAFIESLQDQVYTLAFDYSFSPISDDIEQNVWITANSFPPMRFVPHEKKGFVIEGAAKARSWRVRETNGAVLAIQQIQFAQQPGPSINDLTSTSNIGDTYLYGISQTTYQTFGYKEQRGRPNQYFLFLQNPPVVQFYPSPDVGGGAMPYTHFMFVANQLPQTPETLPSNINMPATFYDSFVAGVAYRLATKFNSSKCELLQSQKQDASMRAAMSDVSVVSIDLSGRACRQ